MVLSDPTHVARDLPAVDDRLAVPGTRTEIYDGELVFVPPSDALHATQHSKTSALVEVHAAPAFEVACELLTGTSRTSDVARDVRVFPRDRDPKTGRRKLEQLAFEVVSTEALGHAARKATLLFSRGVRRVFAIDLRRARVLEWVGQTATWRTLEVGARIEDPALAVALPVDALLHTASVDDAVARALLLKHNPVLESATAVAVAEAKQGALAEGKRGDRAGGRRSGAHLRGT
jgi:hypothetical protein